MSRYIDIEPIEKEIDRELTIGEIKTLSEHQKGALDVYDAIKKTPTADVEKVRHGEWVTRHICCFDWTVCSVCGASFKPNNWENVWKKLYGNPAYCPLCGAKMDKEKEE